MNNTKKLGIIIPIVVIAIAAVAFVGNARANCDAMLSQTTADKDKLTAMALQVAADKRTYNTEWFPTAEDTQSMNSEIALFENALNNFNTQVASYHQQCG